MRTVRLSACVLALCLLGVPGPLHAQPRRLQSSDHLRLRAVTEIALSPDGRRAAYVVQRNDVPGRPTGQVHVLMLGAAEAPRSVAETDTGGSPEWSPDGQWLAFSGTNAGKSGVSILYPSRSKFALYSRIKNHDF